MQLGETIATYDVDLALRCETGKFEVTSPDGEVHYVTCRPNVLGAKTGTPANQAYPRAFLIKKIAESLALDEGTQTHSAAAPADEPLFSVTRAPFLLESREGADRPSSNLDSISGVLQSPEAETLQGWHLDLTYSEGEAKTGRPCVFVCVKSGETGANSQKILTAPCMSFTEMDVAIRRLHAQLDEICLRAKKNFYKSDAAAASA
jgi:hypothetical protein